MCISLMAWVVTNNFEFPKFYRYPRVFNLPHPCLYNPDAEHPCRGRRYHAARRSRLITFILIILVTRMKRDYQDDSSFSSWYPIKPALSCWKVEEQNCLPEKKGQKKDTTLKAVNDVHRIILPCSFVSKTGKAGACLPYSDRPNQCFTVLPEPNKLIKVLFPEPKPNRTEYRISLNKVRGH